MNKFLGMEIIEYRCHEHGVIEQHACADADNFPVPSGCPIYNGIGPCGLPVHRTSA